MTIDGNKLMMLLNDWWSSSFGYDEETEDSKAIKTVMDEIEKNLKDLILESCEDVISRQAAIDALDTGLWRAEWDKVLATAMLKDLPPVQPKPKVGHWISYWDEEARCYVYKCPKCGNKQPFDTKYCWECGTRLIEPQESEG